MTSRLYSRYRTTAGRIRPMVTRGQLEGWICTGVEPESRLPMTLAYAGRRHNAHYMARMLLNGRAALRSVGLVAPDRFLRAAVRYRCDAMIIEADHAMCESLHGLTSFRIPIWTPQRLDVPGDANAVMQQKSLRTLRQHHRAAALRYVATHDAQRLREFYTRLHVPCVEALYGDEAVVHPYRQLLRQFLDGELLMAFDGEEWIGGLLITYSETEGRLSAFGFKSERATTSAWSALFFEAILRVNARRLAVVNFGDSHGFLRDGVFRFKARLGCRVSPHDPTVGRFWTLAILQSSQPINRLLTRHPYISIDDAGKPWGIFFTMPGEEIPLGTTFTRTDQSAALRAAATKDSLCPGLEGIRFYHWAPGSGWRCQTSGTRAQLSPPGRIPSDRPPRTTLYDPRSLVVS